MLYSYQVLPHLYLKTPIKTVSFLKKPITMTANVLEQIKEFILIRWAAWLPLSSF